MLAVADGRVPGEQSWLSEKSGKQNGSQASQALPKEVHSKFPIPGNEGKYLGALVKVSCRILRRGLKLTRRYTMKG
jgi:hypothetical protein